MSAKLGSYQVSHSSPGCGWEANAGTWVPGFISFHYSHLCLQWAWDVCRQTEWRVSSIPLNRQGWSNLGVYSGNFWELSVPIPGKHSHTDFQSRSRS